MLKVLIVEDQPAVSTALKVLFEIRGVDCIVARNPSEAIRALDRQAEEIGVVVQDMNFSPEATSGDEGGRSSGRSSGGTRACRCC